ncbi:hypothetical protein ACVWWG_003815 [Bradyrhizobium sp. LB7.2]
MRSYSRFLQTLLLAGGLILGASSANYAVEIPKPVINVPKPVIPRPVINVPRPAVTVNVPKPVINPFRSLLLPLTFQSPRSMFLNQLLQ